MQCLRQNSFVWHPLNFGSILLAGALLCTEAFAEFQNSTTHQNEQTPDQTPDLLTSAEQVRKLSREEAARGYPALIRGVVTCSLPDSEAAVVQDATRGIYVDQLIPERGASPKIGELIEIEGVTDPGEFAPQIHARRMTRLGSGELPQPIRPTWDQLINGSLDTQFVEVQGIVSSVRADGLTLLTHGGKIEALLSAMHGLALTRYENSLIRLRGCLFASWDARTHQIRVGEIRMIAPSLIVDEPAPKDVFTIPLKHPADLLRFDPQAHALRRVKIAGQVVYQRGGEYFMMDGKAGVRFVPKQDSHFDVGDTVEVVGFPALTGLSPVLREAIARKTGQLPLAAAKQLGANELFQAEHDATRVTLEAVLLSLSADGRTLEMQSGLQRFLARLNDPTRNQLGPQQPISTRKDLDLPIGGRLELTGVYSGHGGGWSSGAGIGSFELLLSSPTDIRVLERPPFWTLKRLLLLVGALVGVLGAAIIWIQLLHRRIQDRTAQLHAEVRERERAEHQRALAQERARLARDLHDDLGSSLTEISMLATTSPGDDLLSEEASERLGTIAGKSRTLVHALDEIVWAVDPQRDTVASAARYLASYAEEYLSGLQIACRVQMPNSFPDLVVSGEVRHHLFLSVKEALNNAVRHGSATEIGFRVSLVEHGMLISISDNGNGFDLSGRSNGNGLLNLQERLRNVNGHCQINSAPGAGTTVSLQFPLNSTPT